MKIKIPMDFWAGLMFIVFGLFFMFVAQDYQMGSAKRMGPAYFPTMVGGLLAILGVIVSVHSLIVKGRLVPSLSFLPLFLITLSLLAFGYLLNLIGMVLALALLVVVSAFAGYEFKIKEVLILSAVLIILSVLVFVKGLALPFPLWPKFMG